jgi:hypothetical protein
MIQSVLPLPEFANVAPTESSMEPLYSIADSTATNPTAIESAIELLHSAPDSTRSGAALTMTCCLCVRV